MLRDIGHRVCNRVDYEPGGGSQQAAEKKKKATSGELFETIARMDSQVFDAFNAHDLERLMALFTDDLSSTMMAAG